MEELGGLVAAEKEKSQNRQRNGPTRCNTHHAGFTCDEYDSYLYDLCSSGQISNPWATHAHIQEHRDSQKRVDGHDPLG